jgi:hypothetical protein
MDGQTIPRLGAGVYSVDAPVYHADPCAEPSLSSSIARLLIDRSPAHAWIASPRLNPGWEPTDRKTFDIGRAAHRAVLGRGGDYVAIPDGLLASNGAASTKEAKAFIEDARAAGMTPLKAAEVDAIGALAAAVSGRLAAAGVAFDAARSEMTAIGQVDGIWCRAMIDNAPLDPRQPLYDLKTTTDASLDAVTRAVCSYGYDIQAAHYLRTWKAATGEDRRFRFVFVEKEPPYEVAIVELYADPAARPASDYSPDELFDGDWLADAEQKLARARSQWRACLDAGKWPGYPARVALIGAPVWHRRASAVAHEYDPIIPAKPTAGALARAAAWQAPN